ncbi:DUF805 domain-containing protein [Sphingomonas sp.]|jgi:uncharacterized membrane protein YhaH (DUF805 family)|uniref:DUF805 domain-containing protein n=1 Tax=Sphingomonas sp. TaxID=28214 RepID=UPI0035C7F329
MDWMLMPLRRYADFSGRSRRKEYWMFALGQAIVLLLITLVAVVTGGFSGDAGGMSVIAIGLFLIYAVGVIVPSLAVQVRRFHDQDKSGWFLLLNFIPYVGGLIVLVFMCIEGTKGENRFGPDPKGGEHLGKIFS